MRQSRRILAVAGVITLVLSATATTAVAVRATATHTPTVSAQSESGTLAACVNKSSGKMKYLFSTTQKCKKGWRKVTWNQTGPQGPAGAAGAAGAQGIQGIQGVQGVPGTSGLIGPAGKVGEALINFNVVVFGRTSSGGAIDANRLSMGVTEVTFAGFAVAGGPEPVIQVTPFANLEPGAIPVCAPRSFPQADADLVVTVECWKVGTEALVDVQFFISVSA